MGKRFLPKLFIIFTLIAAMSIYGCGSDSSLGGAEEEEEEASVTLEDIPDITGVTDADGNTLGDGANPTSFIITLEEKDGLVVSSDGTITVNITGTATEVGSITLTCGEMTPTISVAASETTANTYIVTVSEAWRIGCMTCTLAIIYNTEEDAALSAGATYAVTHLDKQAILSSETTYTFQNACAVSDDFNVANICDGEIDSWTLASYESSGPEWITACGDANNVISFNTDDEENTLDLDFSGYDGKTIAFYKDVNVDDDFTMEIYFVSFSGTPNFALVFTDTSTTTNYRVGIEETDEVDTCTAVADISGPESIRYTASCTGDDAGYIIKLAKSGDTFTQLYRIVGVHDEFQVLSGSSWEDLGLVNSLQLRLQFQSEAGGAVETARIGYIKVSGMTVAGQY